MSFFDKLGRGVAALATGAAQGLPSALAARRYEQASARSERRFDYQQQQDDVQQATQQFNALPTPEARDDFIGRLEQRGRDEGKPHLSQLASDLRLRGESIKIGQIRAGAGLAGQAAAAAEATTSLPIPPSPTLQVGQRQQLTEQLGNLRSAREAFGTTLGPTPPTVVPAEVSGTLSRLEAVEESLRERIAALDAAAAAGDRAKTLYEQMQIGVGVPSDTMQKRYVDAVVASGRTAAEAEADIELIRSESSRKLAEFTKTAIISGRMSAEDAKSTIGTYASFGAHPMDVAILDHMAEESGRDEARDRAREAARSEDWFGASEALREVDPLLSTAYMSRFTKEAAGEKHLIQEADEILYKRWLSNPASFLTTEDILSGKPAPSLEEVFEKHRSDLDRFFGMSGARKVPPSEIRLVIEDFADLAEAGGAVSEDFIRSQAAAMGISGGEVEDLLRIARIHPVLGPILRSGQPQPPTPTLGSPTIEAPPILGVPTSPAPILGVPPSQSQLFKVPIPGATRNAVAPAR